MEFIKQHSLEIVIILLLFILIIGAFRKEHYIGGPLSDLSAWTSGGVQRRGGQIFSATNQGESMSGHRDAPYYMPASQYDRTYEPQSYATKSTMNPPLTSASATLGKEGYRGTMMDEDFLHSQVY